MSAWRPIYPRNPLAFGGAFPMQTAATSSFAWVEHPTQASWRIIALPSEELTLKRFALDRYAVSNPGIGHVSGPHSGPRRAKRAKRHCQPATGSAGYLSRSLWLVLALLTGSVTLITAGQ